MRYLVVNADDFGLSRGVNEGILEARRRGIVTSASLMVLQPAAEAAAEAARRDSLLSLGLHLDFGEWECRGGDWKPLYDVVPLDDEAEVRAETARQIRAFQQLTGRNPTHVDSHQHVHLQPQVGRWVSESVASLAVPLRRLTHGIRYCGAFYGQSGDGSPLPEQITAEALIELIGSLEGGITELACHPGYDEDLRTMYRLERTAEVAALCDPRVRDRLAAGDVKLISFAEAARMLSAARPSMAVLAGTAERHA